MLAAAVTMCALARWDGAPWWFAIPFGPLFVVVSFAGGYFINGGSARGFWRGLIDQNNPEGA
jgi:hypothetical protein